MHFTCLNANIARQFEFVGTAWLTGTKSDPVAGDRQPVAGCPATSTLSRPSDAAVPLWDMLKFVTMGGYFFLPGVSALR